MAIINTFDTILTFMPKNTINEHASLLIFRESVTNFQDTLTSKCNYTILQTTLHLGWYELSTQQCTNFL